MRIHRKMLNCSWSRIKERKIGQLRSRKESPDQEISLQKISFFYWTSTRWNRRRKIAWKISHQRRGKREIKTLNSEFHQIFLILRLKRLTRACKTFILRCWRTLGSWISLEMKTKKISKYAKGGASSWERISGRQAVS